MSDAVKLAAEARTEFGKGASRRARAAGQIPAVLYGHGADPIHVLLPGHQTMMALKHANAVFMIVVGKDEHMTIAKDVQRHAFRPIIEHIDLLVVRKGEKLTVDVPVHLLGESISGTIAMLDHATLQIEAEATHLPERIDVSIEGLHDGAKITAGEITLPAGATLVTDPDVAVVVITVPRQSVADAAVEAAAEAASAAASEASSEAAEAAGASE